MKRPGCVSKSLFTYLLLKIEKVSRCDCFNKGMMELPIKEKEARHTILLLPSTTGHSFSSRHNSAHCRVQPLFSCCFHSSLLFNTGTKNKGGGLKMNSGQAHKIRSVVRWKSHEIILRLQFGFFVGFFAFY